MTCAGCHAGTGRSIDGVFSYARKVDRPEGGWFHWDRRRPLGDLPDPQAAGGMGAYATYLLRNRAGDEFRANDEALQRFFPGGRPDRNAIAALAQRIGPLSDPSPGRALALDKAYRLIVEEQSYDQGRAPILAPLDDTVWRRIAAGTKTGVTEPVD